MNDPERNRQAARRFLEASGKHDAETFSSLMCDDATYWTIGKPHLFDYCGEKSRG